VSFVRNDDASIFQGRRRRDFEWKVNECPYAHMYFTPKYPPTAPPLSYLGRGSCGRCGIPSRQSEKLAFTGGGGKMCVPLSSGGRTSSLIPVRGRLLRHRHSLQQRLSHQQREWTAHRPCTCSRQ